jgi:ubiquinone/menaquinone biosynthesis C-methylase UbiE
MDVQQAYNNWAEQYDTNENKTRDLEAKALREMLEERSFNRCLEIGCGTGKNTEWLITKAELVTAVDFSEEMLVKAKAKILSDRVKFVQADINKPWGFQNEWYDLITFSLVLEHIENLDHIFLQASKMLETGGHLYVGELHPFKQYAGSKARFETAEGLQVVNCYNHNVSDFLKAAKKFGLKLLDLEEYFDGDGKGGIPRILTLVFGK